MPPADRSLPVSARIAVGGGVVLVVAAVIWPALALLASVIGADSSRPVGAPVVMAPPLQLFARSAGYGLVVAVLAGALGWLPGRWIAGAPTNRGRAARAALLLAPACLPPSVMFYAWWQAWPADSALFAWAARHDAIATVRRITLALALAAWGWPLVAWCTAGAAARLGRETLEAMAVDGAPAWRRAAVRIRSEAPGAAAGGLVVAIVVMGHTTAFDLAGVFTAANELRALDAEGAPRGALLELAIGPIVVAAGGALLVIRLLSRRATNEDAMPPRAGALAACGAFVAGAMVLGPLVLLALRLAARSDLGDYVAIYGRSLARSVGLALVTGLVAGGIAIAALAGACGSAGARRVERGGRWCWIAAALVPATLVALGLEAAYNRAGGTVLYGSVAILVLGHLARFGFLPALLGARMAATEPPVHEDLRRLDGARSLWAITVARRPEMTGMVLASTVAVGALAMGEIPVTARVHPPGSDPIVVRLLNDMHYQRPQMVLLTIGALVVAAACAAATLGAGAGRTRRRAAVVLLLSVACAGGGCAERGAGEPLAPRVVFGTNGTALGQFSYPRCIALDPERGVLYVVDKTARVQRYGLDGTPQMEWSLPARENGKPTGISVAPDGRVLVADTHYHRVMVYDADGNELQRFGRYGEGPGEFIYPTDVAVGPEGRLYVSEYGGNDRIQVFEPDGTYRTEFGCVGPVPDGLERPQSIAFNSARTELFIVDACHHRVVVTDPDGVILRAFGGAGAGAGQMLYPYGLDVRPDGTIVVSEFGNHRIQHFAPDGTPKGHYGQLGAGPGQLRYPWGVAGTTRELFVLDSGNNRVQVIRAP